MARKLRDCGSLDLNFWSVLGRGSGWRVLVVKTEVRYHTAAARSFSILQYTVNQEMRQNCSKSTAPAPYKHMPGSLE